MARRNGRTAPALTPAVDSANAILICSTRKLGANRADDAMVKNHFRRPRDLRQTSGASCECLLLGVAHTMVKVSQNTAGMAVVCDMQQGRGVCPG